MVFDVTMLKRDISQLCFLLLIPATLCDLRKWREEFTHAARRDQLIAETWDAENIGRRDSMSHKERVVDIYLQYLRNELYHEEDTENYPAMMHCVQKLKDLQSTQLYAMLKQMPKGANLHVHENHQLDRHRFLDILWESSIFENLYILPENHSSNPWMLDFFIYPPKDDMWINVKNNSKYTKEIIYEHITLLSVNERGRECTENHSGKRWTVANPVWAKLRQVIRHRDIKEKYMTALLEDTMEHNIQYMETRKGLMDRLYILDPEAIDTFGKRYLSTEEDIRVGISVIETFKKEHHQFIGFKRIGQSYRYNDASKVSDDVDHVIRMHEKYPDHVIGFDLIAEEDKGNSLLYHFDSLKRVKQFQREHPKFKLFLHAAETNFPEDVLMTLNKQDPVSALENAYDALLLEPVRIGHGLGFVKHPHLVEALRDLDIAVEVCPISNSVFGYICDIRMHPSLHLLRAKVPLVISSDTEGTMGTDITTDWHILFMAWGLSLFDMKQMANNSLTYTALTDTEKRNALASWTTEWNHFINQFFLIICSGVINEVPPSFNKVFPGAAPLHSQVNVHIYGRHFERAICNDIVCKFGRRGSFSGKYVSYSHIICTIPTTENKQCDSVDCGTNENVWLENTQPREDVVNVFISFDGGQIFHDTRRDFVFLIAL